MSQPVKRARCYAEASGDLRVGAALQRALDGHDGDLERLLQVVPSHGKETGHGGTGRLGAHTGLRPSRRALRMNGLKHRHLPIPGGLDGG